MKLCCWEFRWGPAVNYNAALSVNFQSMWCLHSRGQRFHSRWDWTHNRFHALRAKTDLLCLCVSRRGQHAPQNQHILREKEVRLLLTWIYQLFHDWLNWIHDWLWSEGKLVNFRSLKDLFLFQIEINKVKRKKKASMWCSVSNWVGEIVLYTFTCQNRTKPEQNENSRFSRYTMIKKNKKTTMFRE